jgi:hypothetical protein
MDVSSELNTPYSWKQPLVPVGSEAMWAPEPVWTQWRAEKSLLLVDTEARFPSHPAHSLVTILEK